MQLDFLKSRSFVKEDMDDFALEGEELISTISGLSTINKFLGNSDAILGVLKPIIQHSDSSLTIIDLGCGGADILLEIAAYADKLNKEIYLTGIDGNPNIINLAKENNKAYPNLQFLDADIIDPNFSLPKCDILISTHFMYHFTDQQLITFLSKHSKNIQSKIIFSELQRSVFSYLGFQILSFLLRFPKMIHSDGLKAICRSFRKRELDFSGNGHFGI